MAGDAGRLLEIAAAVSDGREIDWDAEKSAAPSEAAREVLRALELLARVGALNRSGAGPAAAVFAHAMLQSIDPRAGAPAWGPLHLLERVAAGRFGEVYRAWDPRLDRDVALKLLHADADPVASAVVHEARLLARVRHPNVITVHGADVIDGRVGLWMEYIRGRTLADEVAADGPLDARQAGSIGIDLCRALAAVHAAGLVHRDVKAQNVMRDTEGRVVLMDFGAGGEQSSWRVTNGVAGTPLYLAPELFEGAAATIRSDIYSVGVLLYFLVTGRYPVTGESLDELRVRHSERSRQPLRDARPDLATELVDAVDRALAEEPYERYESAEAFEAALAGSLDPDPDAGPEQVAVNARPHAPRWLLGIVAAMAIASMMGAVGWWRFRPVTTPVRAVPIARLFANLTREGARPVRIPLGASPCDAALTPDGRTLYVSDYEGDGLLVIDTTRKTIARRMPIAGHPCALAMSPDGRTLFVGRHDGNAVTVVQTSDGSTRDVEVRSRITDLLATPDGRSVYVATPYAGLWRMDTRTEALERVPVVGCPMYLASDGVSRLYVSFQCQGPGGSPGHDAVGVFDLATGRPAGRAQGPPQVGGPLAASPDAPFLWVNGADACGTHYDNVGCPHGSHSESVVNVFQTTDFAFVRSLPLPSGAGDIAFLPGGTRVVVADAHRSHVFDARSFAIAETLDSSSIGQPMFSGDGRSTWAILDNAATAVDPLPAECELPSAGLADLWTADGSAADLASAMHGDLQAGATFVPGIVGQAFAFDGISGQVVLANRTLDAWGQHDATLLAWVKFLSAGREMPIIDENDVKEPQRGGWRLLKTADDRLAFCIGYPGTHGCDSADLLKVASTSVVRPNAWYHVAVTKSGDTLSLYVNGRRESGTGGVPLDLRREAAAGRFGADDAGNHLHGMIDEVARYTRALEGADIERIYRNATAPRCTGGRR